MQIARKIIDNISTCIVGKEELIETVVAAMFCRGHILIEDVPGLGKTVLAKALALSIEADFKRIQMTPDLLPSDVTGVPIFNQQRREFEFRPGPIFSQILLADELNRATPRTQSALLESMEELQVSVDGESHPLPKPFCVLATQNPLEQHGVYHLPEAQLDRFIIQISLGYPNMGEELEILRQQNEAHPIESLQPVVGVEEVLKAQNEVHQVFIDPSVSEYIVRLCRATRQQAELLIGGSPRASLSLRRMAQAWSLIEEHPFVYPETVKKLFLPVLRHRVILTPQARLSGTKVDDVLLRILNQVEAPVSEY